MNYLIFDIECCDGKHICEFGYVLFTENFELLARECITMNPEYKFKLTGREHESDIKLAFPEEVYFSSPTYGEVYEKMKSIIQTPDCKIIGFSMSNDAGFLATANELYEKEAIEFEFLDFQILYQAYTKAQNRTSVENMVKELELENITLHKSDDDSYAVMLALKRICEKEKLSLPATLKLLKKLKGNYMAEKARTHNLSLIEKLENGNLKAQKEFLHKFIKGLKFTEIQENSVFTGKSVCVCQNYQRKYFNQFLSLIEMLYSVGAMYQGKASECDIFITTDDEGDIRYISAKRALEEGRAIVFLPLEKVFTTLLIDESQLNQKDHIKSKVLKEKNPRSYKESQPTTLGELLKVKGVDIAKII